LEIEKPHSSSSIINQPPTPTMMKIVCVFYPTLVAALLLHVITTSAAFVPLSSRHDRSLLSQLRQTSLTNEEISRYSRHLVLTDVGMKGQIALKDASVLVVGAGGLGSPCLLYLAAAGVGHIGIVDGDTVDESNLQRQIIHGTSTIGMSKVQSAAKRIHDINPNVLVRLYEQELTSQTALGIVQEGFEPGRPYDVVIDGSDNFPTKYLIKYVHTVQVISFSLLNYTSYLVSFEYSDVCAMTGITWIYSAILAFEGQLSVFNLHGTGPDYRDLLPTPPPPGDVPSCAEGGVLGVLPGTFGCLQATEAIKYILGHYDGLLSGRVLVMNTMAMKFTEIHLERAAGREAITELIDYQGFCGGPQTTPPPTVAGDRTMDEAEVEDNKADLPSFHSVDPKECLQRMVDGWSPWVLDVRLATENEIVALPFTDRVAPHRTVKVKDIPKEGDVLVYCKAGVRGKKACNRLIQQGVAPERLYNLEGGIMKWKAEVDPSMPRY
jgi:molybdopterin/thiamine biosynthesis adenylyltransferase/rhodanese-related sulfurtransferase